VDSVLGSPARPLAADVARAKYEMCWHAAPALPPAQAIALWNAVSALESLEDVRVIAALSAPPKTGRA
jgi:hypothetical protein